VYQCVNKTGQRVICGWNLSNITPSVQMYF